MIELYWAQSFSIVISSLTMATFILMIIYMILGNWFASKHLAGQLLFLGIGVLLAIFGGQVMSALNIHLSLVPLSLGPIPVTLLWNSSDVTWVLPLAFVLLLLWAWHNGDLEAAKEYVT